MDSIFHFVLTARIFLCVLKMDIDYTQNGISEKRFRSLKGKQKVRRAIRPREGDKRSDITANHSRLSAVVR